jgi:hypothetical protein
MIAIQRAEGLHQATLTRLVLDWVARVVDMTIAVTLPDGTTQTQTVRYEKEKADRMLESLNSGDFRVGALNDAAVAATVYDGSIRVPSAGRG